MPRSCTSTSFTAGITSRRHSACARWPSTSANASPSPGRFSTTRLDCDAAARPGNSRHGRAARHGSVVQRIGGGARAGARLAPRRGGHGVAHRLSTIGIRVRSADQRPLDAGGSLVGAASRGGGGGAGGGGRGGGGGRRRPPAGGGGPPFSPRAAGGGV